MEVVLASDKIGESLKNTISQHLIDSGFKVLDVTVDKEVDSIDATLLACEAVGRSQDKLAIVVDDYGVASFMTATKIKGMVAAEVSDERTAYMTRGHNNARLITIGSKIVGEELAKNIAKAFVTGTYDGGRHQIRVDMLNKMC